MTQEQLAFEAQIDLTYVGGIERGRRNPSLMVMARLAEALGAELKELLEPYGAAGRQPYRSTPPGEALWRSHRALHPRPGRTPGRYEMGSPQPER